MVYYYANGSNPKQRDDAGKGVCDPEKRYHPENVLRCQLVAKTFRLFVTGLFLCPILVIRIWRGRPLSQILDSKEPCLPTLAPIALLWLWHLHEADTLRGLFRTALGWERLVLTEPA